MTIVYKSNHAQEAVQNLISLLRVRPDLVAWLRSYIREIQEAEVVLDDISRIADLEQVDGDRLDLIGAIVGEPRSGRTDVPYRTAIRARIRLNLSRGTSEDIVGLIQGIAGPVRVRIFEFFPAGFVAQLVDPIDPTEVDPSRIGQFVQDGRGAAIEAQTVIGVTGSFRFDSGPGFDEGLYAAVF